MRPGVGGPVAAAAMSAEQLAEIKRLQSLGYAGGSQPVSTFTGTTINQPDFAAPNLRFYLSGHAPGATLIDPAGHVLHTWQFSYA
ncbi:MAG: hypothetical protein ACI9JE_000829, partial [Candidatus Krumholzibacteriia bacterium]